MKRLKRSEKYAKCVMAVALLAAILPLAAHAEVGVSGSVPLDNDQLMQIKTLHGLSAEEAIKRLAAEAEAMDMYRRVTAMAIDGYAGAWFDATSQKLHVALKGNPAQAKILSQLDVITTSVKWSLRDLEQVRQHIESGNAGLVRGETLRTTHIDYRINRVVVGVQPEHIDRAKNLIDEYSEIIKIEAATKSIKLTADVRGADGTRNHTWFLLDSLIHPCSIGASVENGYYTAGHCGFATNAITTPGGIPLGTVIASGYVGGPALSKDIGWTQTSAGWTPTPKINGYSDGLLYVTPKWSGIAPSMVGTTVCRYGQTSGGPHCGEVESTGFSDFDGWAIQTNLTRVKGSCSDDGDSGGTWVQGGSTSVIGTNVGAVTVNTCPIETDFTFYQPISDHIAAYAGTAGSLLTTHGASSPTVSGFLCPDMGGGFNTGSQHG